MCSWDVWTTTTSFIRTTTIILALWIMTASSASIEEVLHTYLGVVGGKGVHHACRVVGGRRDPLPPMAASWVHGASSAETHDVEYYREISRGKGRLSPCICGRVIINLKAKTLYLEGPIDLN